MLQQALLEEKRAQLEQYLNDLPPLRQKIFGDRHLAFGFCKFIAPVQIGDERPEGFLLPFPLTPP